MEITYHNSATVLIKDNDTKILTDPWLISGEYFGAWGIYPPYKFNPKEFDDVDYIYISHIHPDHCSASTLSKLNKKIPVLIHNFPVKALKNTIERLGFTVIELENNKRIELKNNLNINIIASDNCNPEICGKVFGCVFKETSRYDIVIDKDTMAVIDNGREVIVNTNDCPIEIAETTAKTISKQYEHIDFLLVGYVGASSYPQCYGLSKNEHRIEAEKKMTKRLNGAIKYLQIFNPTYFMPFAGTYTLSGKHHYLNKLRGESELDYAVDFFTENIEQNQNQCVALNSKESFDLATGKCTKKYMRIDENEKAEYTKNVLSKTKFSYESQPFPNIDSLEKLLPKSYEQFNNVRKQLCYQSETKIILKLNQNKHVVISCNDQGYETMTCDEIKTINNFISMELDPRLLFWLLQGPKKALWTSAELGSHIQFKRIPNIYEMGLMHCWGFFYSGQYIN